MGIMCALLLTFAYRNVSQGANAQLGAARKFATSNHKKLGLTKEEFDHIQEQVTAREAVAWSFIQNNLIFVLTFLFFAFYALKEVASQYNYTLSVILSSGIVYQISASMY